MSEIKTVLIEYVGPYAPFYASEEASGADLRANIEEDELLLKPYQRVLVSTGVSIALPKGCEAQVRSRSGLAVKHGVVVLNGVGTVDSDYRGEIKVLLINLSEEAYRICKGERIAQLVIADVIRADYKAVEVLDVSSRGHGGFGSTGAH
jgi:dUTP pyrophosphatase